MEVIYFLKVPIQHDKIEEKKNQINDFKNKIEILSFDLHIKIIIFIILTNYNYFLKNFVSEIFFYFFEFLIIIIV